MMRSLLGVAGALTLAGCLGQPAKTPDVATVSWGNIGSTHGGYQVSIDSNDIISSRIVAGNGDITETEHRASDGTFGIIDQRATFALDTLNVSPSSLTCLDAGTTYIARSNGNQRTRRVETQCSEPEFDTAIMGLNALITQHLSLV